MNDFQVLEELGRGSSSVVHLAVDKRLDRLVALKRLLRTRSGEREEEARLLREAQIVARLDHPAVVRLYDLAYDGSDVVLVMEYVSGPTVRALFRRSSPLPSQALAVVGDVAMALEYASKRGVVHRDVKPANVFVTREGRCKLGDFGLARMTMDERMFRSGDSLARGTPFYMSPEQLEGDEPTSASDVYSLALVAWELLTGSHPFAGMTVPEVINAHFEGKASTAPAPVHLPSALVDPLRDALALRTDRRPTPVELFERLRDRAPAEWFDEAASEPRSLFVSSAGGVESFAQRQAAEGWKIHWSEDRTWPGIDARAQAEEEGIAAQSPDSSLPESSFGTVRIDDDWVRPQVVDLGARQRIRRIRLGWVAAAFLAGFALILIVLNLV
jgi:serine/threonine protein kinase